MPRLDSQPGGKPRPSGERRVRFSGSLVTTPVYERAILAAGQRLEGPAVVQEFGSTTVVFPGQRLEVDPHGIMIIRSGGRP